MLKTLSQWFFLALFFLACGACNRTQSTGDAPTPMVRSEIPPEQQIVHKTFSVQKYESFEVQIPPHCLRPRLHGDFRAFRYGEQGNRASDEAASVDVLLMDEQQFNDFVHGPGDATTRAEQNTYERQID